LCVPIEARRGPVVSCESANLSHSKM
jgi:hypothetical protein